MKTGLEIYFSVYNFLYYIGITLAVYLYVVDNNTWIWLIAEGLIVVGFLNILILDFMVNFEVGNISISIARGTSINKYLMFFILHTLLDKCFLLVIVILGIGLLIELYLNTILFYQIKKSCISIGEFIEKLKGVDTTASDKILNYYALYIICIVLYLQIHSNIYEMVIMMLISSAVHFFVSNKIMEQIKCNAKWKIRLLFWIVFFLTIVFATFNLEMITYSIIGTYVMIAQDLTQAGRSALIKIEYFERKENK